jgi:secreted PhoX family phosphatase
MGASGLVVAAPPLVSSLSCAAPAFKLKPLKPGTADDLVLSDGLSYRVVISWGDEINALGHRFGFNNDYIAFLPGQDESSAKLWVNHEYVDPWFVSGYHGGEKTEEQIRMEMYAVGGSLLDLTWHKGAWRVDESSESAKQFTAFEPIRLVSPRPIAGTFDAIGTLGNCAGGVTPWGTVLTCEENYEVYYGEVTFENGERKHTPGGYGWGKLNPYPPEHYGWVVEVDPDDKSARKLTALGRFSHECATVREAPDGRCAVYTGDDKEGECLYKFISDDSGSLETGTLHVANLEQGRWIPLDINRQEILRQNFTDQTEVMIRCREAAHLVGGTPLDRPEDVEVDPKTGAVIVSLTNNMAQGNLFGSLLRIQEKDNDPLSLEFEHATFMAGGPSTGFACPDNLAFDKAGNLWMTSDMSTGKIGSDGYAPFGNNGLFFIPMSGKDAGRVIQVASAPVAAELTGPCFTPDGRTLFLSVQHPGEGSHEGRLLSHWPNGGEEIPRPSVVAIAGPALDAIIEGRIEVTDR